jgi:hypothetical protein
MRIKDITDKNGTYEPNPLSNAHMLIANHNIPKIGTTNICKEIVNWVENNTKLEDAMKKDKRYFTNGGDSMGHIMKGNIGFFISCGTDIIGNNIFISDIFNNGEGIGTSLCIKQADQTKQGATSNGILFTGSCNVSITGKIEDIRSEYGAHYELYNINSKKITFNNETVLKNE